MGVEDKQIQIWATPIGDRTQVVFGARLVASRPVQWAFWGDDDMLRPSVPCSMDEGLDQWSVEGSGRSWDAIEVLAASPEVALTHLADSPIDWPWERRWWWRNDGPDQGQDGVGGSVNAVSRVEAICSLREFLEDPSVHPEAR